MQVGYPGPPLLIVYVSVLREVDVFYERRTGMRAVSGWCLSLSLSVPRRASVRFCLVEETVFRFVSVLGLFDAKCSGFVCWYEGIPRSVSR